MTIQYKIHWISMWNYAINQNLLDSEFFVKWWDKFKLTDIISKLHDDFPLPVKSSKELKDLA